MDLLYIKIQCKNVIVIRKTSEAINMGLKLIFYTAPFLQRFSLYFRRVIYLLLFFFFYNVRGNCTRDDKRLYIEIFF